MEPKSCALIGGSRAAELLKKGEKSTACLRFKMALAVQLAQLIDAGICHFFSCMQPGAEQWAAAMVLEFARSRPDISLTVMATPELERPLPAWVERQAKILHKKSRRACLAWMAASDMLALNKDEFTAVVTLPMSIFSSETVDTYDEEGNKTGTERVTYADMDYVTDALKEAGLIEYKWLFNVFCKISTASEKVSPGEYELKSTFDYRALIQNMRAGSASTVTVDVTLPEGFTMRQIFQRLEEMNVCSYDELMESAANDKFNYSFLEGMEEGDATRLEGFLFPDTYEFYVGMQASSAINKMLETFYYKQTADMLKQASDMNMSMREIVNVASLIEKEAANDAERALIASVIYNRIYAGMQLGIDASVLYEYPDHEGAPTAEMLQTDSPYNTRIRTGLPPTPICNPGMASIIAALNPESTGYYYYALDTATGEHRFFTNETEFNNFVATQDYS